MSAMTVVFCLTMVAQKGKEERRAMIQSKKVAFCTERAGLTEDESVKYWALRNEVNDLKKELMSEVPKQKEFDLENASDQEIENMLRTRKEQHIKADELELSYLDKFLDVLPAKKLALILKAEREFKKEVLRDMRDRRRNGEHIDGHQRGKPERN